MFYIIFLFKEKEGNSISLNEKIAIYATVIVFFISVALISTYVSYDRFKDKPENYIFLKRSEYYLLDKTAISIFEENSNVHKVVVFNKKDDNEIYIFELEKIPIKIENEKGSQKLIIERYMFDRNKFINNKFILGYLIPNRKLIKVFVVVK